MEQRENIQVVGFCPNVGRVIEWVRTGRFDLINRDRGDYVAVSEKHDETVLASSATYVQRYFFSENLPFRHGSRLSEVRPVEVENCDPLALVCLYARERVAHGRTLQVGVRTMEPGMTVRAGRAGVTRDRLDWEARFANSDRTLDAKGALLRSLEEAREGPVFLALTGGLDSRVILAGLLHLGIRPTCFTHGLRDSVDLRLARQLARHFDLELRQEDIPLGSFLGWVPRLTDSTGGTLLVGHTIHALGVRHLVEEGAITHFGQNGDFARGGHLDLGSLTPLINWNLETPKRRLLEHMFRNDLKLGLAASGVSRRQMGPLLASLDPDELRMAHIERGIREIPGRLVSGYDRLRQTELIGHLGGGIVSAANLFADARAAMCDRDWVCAVSEMPFRDKRGAAWHRKVLSELLPEAMRFPYYGKTVEPEIAPRPPRLHWITKRKRSMAEHYGSDTVVFGSPAYHEFVMENSHRLAPLLSRSGLEAIFAGEDTHLKKWVITIASLAAA